MGPNEKGLIAARMGNLATPAGGEIAVTDHEAAEWVRAAIAVMRADPECPQGTDEEICGVLLHGELDEQKRATPPN